MSVSSDEKQIPTTNTTYTLYVSIVLPLSNGILTTIVPFPRKPRLDCIESTDDSNPSESSVNGTQFLLVRERNSVPFRPGQELDSSLLVNGTRFRSRFPIRRTLLFLHTYILYLMSFLIYFGRPFGRPLLLNKTIYYSLGNYIVRVICTHKSVYTTPFQSLADTPLAVVVPNPN